jgi:hypothetical protein
LKALSNMNLYTKKNLVLKNSKKKVAIGLLALLSSLKGFVPNRRYVAYPEQDFLLTIDTTT